MEQYKQAMAAFRAGDVVLAEELARQALSAARATDDATAEVDALCILARVALRAGDFATMERLATEAAGVAARTGGPRIARMPLHLQAAAARMAGDLARARALYEQSLELNTQLGEAKMVAAEQRNLAYVELNDGADRRAVELFLSARSGARAAGYTSLEPYLVADAAAIAAIESDPVRAARLLATVESSFERSGQLPDPDDALELRRLRDRLIRTLGETRFATIYAEGIGQTIEEAMSSL